MLLYFNLYSGHSPGIEINEKGANDIKIKIKIINVKLL
jgi:hypothetical protein